MALQAHEKYGSEDLLEASPHLLSGTYQQPPAFLANLES